MRTHVPTTLRYADADAWVLQSSWATVRDGGRSERGSIACGKKNPESQKHTGGPAVSHCAMNRTRSIMSTTHDDSGLSDG